MKNRVIDVRTVPASSLRPHDRNWREHPQRQRDAFDMVLEDIGFAGSLVARLGDDGELHLIDGHLRAERAGDAEVPVVVTDLTADEADELLVVYDPIGEMAETSRERLAGLVANLREREIAIPQGANDALDRIIRAQRNAQVRESIPATALTVSPPGRYRVIVANPKWPVRLSNLRARQPRVLPYATMRTPQLLDLEIPATDDAHLWFWFLPGGAEGGGIEDAVKVVTEWGFRILNLVIWSKPWRGMKAVGRPCFNFAPCLFCSRGRPVLRDETSWRALFDAERESHSELPAEFYAIVRRITHGPRLDMFAAQGRPGFDAWGSCTSIGAAQ